MNDALNCDLDEETRDDREYTTRIIRAYRRTRHEEFVFERLDWEPLLEEAAWTDDKLSRLEQLLGDSLHGGNPSVVLIKDLLKGVISEAVVEWLARGPGKDARWYVSSKKWEPKWLPLLKDVDLRLLLVPQVAAQEALRNEWLSSWIIRYGPTREAMKLVDNLYDVTGAQRIVVLPEGFSALARATVPAAAPGFDSLVQSQVAFKKIPVSMGGASIFFPAMVACLEHPKTEKLGLVRTISVALKTTFDWVNSEAGRVLDPTTWKPDPTSWPGNETFHELKRMFTQPATKNEVELGSLGDIHEFLWSDEDQRWQQAYNYLDHGVITLIEPLPTKPTRQIQLWRSMVEVKGIVSCEDVRRKELRNLFRGIQRFSHSGQHHVSCMLIASPGSGKTFLARQLAESADLHFVPFNITQMRSKNDILACFDTIVATQDEHPRQRLLVFIDEINAELDGSPTYGAFLTPLEDGLYVRDGKTFHITPCAWVFAGTDDPRSVTRRGIGELNRAHKGSDFISRLSLGTIDSRDLGVPRFDLSHDEKSVVEALLGLENIYLGVSILRSEFPDVRKVSREVLDAFGKLPSKARIRDMKHFVRRFEYIAHGQVTSVNVPRGGWPCDEDNRLMRAWQESLGKKPAPADVDIVDP